MSDDSSISCLSTNTDISGLGVRIALYAYMSSGMVLMFVFTKNVDSFHDAARTSFITSTALIVSAIVSWQTGGGGNSLSLFDAFIVTTLTSLSVVYAFIVGTQTRPFSAFRIRFPKSNQLAEVTGSTQFILLFATLIHTVFWATFGMIVWAGPGKFGGGSGGSPPDCSDVVFWIFRHTPSAADRSLRAFALFAFAAGSLVSVVLAVRALQWNWWARREALARLRQEQADAMARRQASSGPLAPVQDAVVQDPAHVGNGSASGQVPSGEPTGNGQAVGDRNEHGNGNGGGQLQLTGVIHSYPPRPVGQPSPNGLTQPSRPPLPPEQGADGGQGRPAFINRPLSLPWAFPPIVLPDPWNKRVPTLLWIAISSIVIASWVYIIVTTEMTITANQERSQTSVFSLGQIMSLVLLLDQVVFQGMTQIYEKLLRDNFAHAQAAGYFALEAERQGGRIPMVPPPPAAN